MSRELLLDIGEVFPSVGMVVPELELNFRLAAKYTPAKVKDVLESLVEKGVLTRFEFNNTIHYKAKEDIPINVGESKTEAINQEKLSPQIDHLRDLSEIVLEIAKTIENPHINELVKKYQDTYN